METLKQLIVGNELVVAPCVLNPIMAKLAQDTGFKAGYISGGSLGWLKCVTEANLSLHEMAQLALDIKSVSPLPLVLDAGGGWGDPVHMHRTMALSEAAGYDALEVEDQYLPRRVHHHIGVERLIEPELMVQKIRELKAARTNAKTLIIARTNALRLTGMDDALRRAEMFHKAGADMLFVHTRSPEEIRTIGERLPTPLMIFAPPEGFGASFMSKQEMYGLGYRLAASSGSAFAAMYKAVRQSYECLMNGQADPFLADGGPGAQLKRAHATCELPRLLEIERNTTGAQ
jgi:methylisocitrate lyase